MPETRDRTFAARLRATIESDPSIKPASLATKAGLSNSVVRKILTGDTQSPSLDTAMRLCRALGTTLEDFMSGAYEGAQTETDAEAQRIRALLSQLTLAERRLLVTYGEGLRDARAASLEESSPDDD